MKSFLAVVLLIAGGVGIAELAITDATVPVTVVLTDNLARDSIPVMIVGIKNNKLVFAYNNAGVVTYIGIPMDSSTTTTLTHSTTAP